MVSHANLRKEIRAVAVFEAAKGAIAVATGFALLALLHHDVSEIAEALIRFLHLDPDRKLPHMFLNAASELHDNQLRIFAVVCWVYALVRFIEAFGLWREQRWAEWFALVTSVFAVPFEIRGMLHHRHPIYIYIAALLINLLIVAIMAYVIVKTQRLRKSPA